MAEKKAETKPAKEPRKQKTDPVADVLDNIAAMPDHDRDMAMRFHAIVARTAPQLTPRLWYGMPAYAKDGKVLCFFQSAAKFKARYATFGFEEVASLDDGAMWPTAYAITELGDEEEARIEALILKALG